MLRAPARPRCAWPSPAARPARGSLRGLRPDLHRAGRDAGPASGRRRLPGPARGLAAAPRLPAVSPVEGRARAAARGPEEPKGLLSRLPRAPSAAELPPLCCSRRCRGRRGRAGARSRAGCREPWHVLCLLFRAASLGLRLVPSTEPVALCGFTNVWWWLSGPGLSSCFASRVPASLLLPLNYSLNPQRPEGVPGGHQCHLTEQKTSC